ncbi:MAG: carotenoid biosynthesis protein [Bacteroidota bacterium]
MNRSFTSASQSVSHSSIAISYAAGFLLLTHTAGIIGLAWPFTRPYFLLATPANLLVSAVLLVIFQFPRNFSFYLFAIICFIVGFLIEVIGVQTKVIFGSYQYGSTLGYKLWDVPLVIGINWFILSYSFGILCHKMPLPGVLRGLIGALLMVALDFFIEPVAVFFDFWTWENEKIPIQNYWGWFGVAFVLQLFFVYLPFAKKNPLAPYLLFAQVLFFVILGSIV